jgi:hypothetical protein
LVAPGHAQAGHFFFSFGAPLYFPPPFVVPAPVFVAPPPVVFAPPPAWSVTPAPPQWSVTPGQVGGQSCYAGPYVCPMQSPVPTGAACWCPNNGGGRSYGHAS